MAEAAGLQTVGCFQTIWSNGAIFARALDPAACLVRRLRDLPQLPDILVLDLGTNDLCLVRAAASGVIDEAMASIELLRNSHLPPEHLVFMGVVQRTAASCHWGVPVHVFNRQARAFNCRLAARVGSLQGVHTCSLLNRPGGAVCQPGRLPCNPRGLPSLRCSPPADRLAVPYFVDVFSLPRW